MSLTVGTVALAGLLFIQAALAMPQQTPYANQTIPLSSSATPTITCSADCGLALPEVTHVMWQSFPINTTITAATIVTIVNKNTNTTRISTKYNELPSGYTLPDTNAEGTVVTSLVRSDYIAKTNYTTVLAYPTLFEDYGYSYMWQGVLPTSINGQLTCATATSSVAMFSSHPPWPSLSVSFPSNGDKIGTNFKAISYVKGASPDVPFVELGKEPEFWQLAFPDLSAFQLCSTYPAPAPMSVWETASFLTDTSISYEENDESTVAPTTQDGSSTPTAPPMVDANPTPNGNPSPADVSPPIVTSSLADGESSTTEGTFNPDSDIPADTSSSNPDQSQASVNAPNVDLGAAPSLDDRPSLSPSALKATEDSPSRSTMVADLVQSMPASPPSNAPLSGQVNNPPTLAPGRTIAPDGPAQTISGITISLAPSASYIAINEATFTLAAEAAALSPAPNPVLTIGGGTYTQSNSQYIIEGQTLGLNSAITLGSDSSTTVLELQTATNGATEVIIEHSSGRSTSTLAPAGAPMPTRAHTDALPPFTLAGQTYTANSLGQYSLGPSLTLTPGGIVTLGGTRISPTASESNALNDGSGTSSPRATDTNTESDASPSSILNGGDNSTSTGILTSTNGAGRRSGKSSGLLWIYLVGIAVVGYLGAL